MQDFDIVCGNKALEKVTAGKSAVIVFPTVLPQEILSALRDAKTQMKDTPAGSASIVVFDARRTSHVQMPFSQMNRAYVIRSGRKPQVIDDRKPKTPETVAANLLSAAVKYAPAGAGSQ